MSPCYYGFQFQLRRCIVLSIYHNFLPKENVLEIIIRRDTQELRGAIIGDRRWIISSSVGRATGIKEAKSFGKALIKKEALSDWSDSFVASGFGVDRHQDLYAIKRRVMSASLACYIAAHGRVSSEGVSTYMFLLQLHAAGYDKNISNCSPAEFAKNAKEYNIIIKE